VATVGRRLRRRPTRLRRPARRPSSNAGRSALRIAVLALPLLTSGCIKEGISDKATEVHGLFYTILWLALPVFAFVEGVLLYCVVRFRKRRHDDAPPRQNPGSPGALAAFFAAPLAIVIVLLAFGESAVANVNRNDPHPMEQLVITGFQWEWSARYVTEKVTVTGKTNKSAMLMELPVDEPTRIELRATDVMHEFYVPDLLYMKNAVPGHPNVFTITPNKVGTYHGQCAQYCGLWHSRMTLTVKVVPQQEFQRWLAQEAQAHVPGSGSCQATGSAFTLVASQTSWDKDCVGVVAGAPFQITITNKDRGIDHNFAIYDSPDLGHRFYLSGTVTGVATKTFTAPALPAGTYYFQCDIHGPAMAGTLVVH
jgi:cytochrome c oxidase subunit 2